MVGVAVIMLVIGVGLGPVVFPMNRTKTESQLYSVTSTQTVVRLVNYSNTETTTLVSNALTIFGYTPTYPVITLTVQVIDVYQVIPTCTTISGSATVVYSRAVIGDTITVSYIFPPEYDYGGIPPNFLVTVTTASSDIISNHTQSFTGSCG